MVGRWPPAPLSILSGAAQRAASLLFPTQAQVRRLSPPNMAAKRRGRHRRRRTAPLLCAARLLVSARRTRPCQVTPSRCLRRPTEIAIASIWMKLLCTGVCVLVRPANVAIIWWSGAPTARPTSQDIVQASHV